LSLSKHYCAGELASRSINSENHSCAKHKNKSQLPGINKPSCCKNEFLFFKSFDFTLSEKQLVKEIVIQNKVALLFKRPTQSIFQINLDVRPPPKNSFVILNQQFIIW